MKFEDRKIGMIIRALYEIKPIIKRVNDSNPELVLFVLDNVGRRFDMSSYALMNLYRELFNPVNIQHSITDENNDNEDEQDDNENEDRKDEFEAFIKAHKQSTDKFDYILSEDIKDDNELREYLTSQGWQYKTKILNRVINKRGYRLNK